MTKDKALKQVLETLEGMNHEDSIFRGEFDDDIAAIKEALKQPEQEPVLQDIEQYRMQMAGIITAAMGCWKEGDDIHPDYDTVALRDVARLYAKYDALYKAQPEQELVFDCPRCGHCCPQRTWVGLTDEEIKTLPQWFPSHESAAVMPLIRAFEAKLREKNT